MFYQFRRELVQTLLQEHEVVLAMPYVGHEEKFMEMGCKCIDTKLDRRSVNVLGEAKLIMTYYRLLKSEKPDVVITYSIKPNVYAGTMCRMLKIPYFVNVQGIGTAFQSPKMAKVATILYKIGLKKARAVFFENAGNAAEFVNRGIIKEDKIKLLNGAGVNLDHYALKEYPEVGKTTRFLYLGRIMKEKGIDEMTYAIRKLHAKYGDKVILDIVGFYEECYKEQVESLTTEGIAVFHGFQCETRPFYERAHCVVLPSYHEGMSNVLLEAASCGRPLITCDIHGCKEAVEDGVTGYLCQAKDGESLYGQMDKFMQLTHEKCREMGIKGREKMEREFDKAKVVGETVKTLMSK
jgi:galacturonosyltransferase